MLTRSEVISQFFPQYKDLKYKFWVLWVPPFKMFAIAGKNAILLQNQIKISCDDMQECLDLGLTGLDAAAHVAAKMVLGPGQAKILKGENK